jgi:hypothetical protein
MQRTAVERRAAGVVLGLLVLIGRRHRPPGRHLRACLPLVVVLRSVSGVGPAAENVTPLICERFVMFVPSLSWQNDRFEMQKWLRQRAFSAPLLCVGNPRANQEAPVAALPKRHTLSKLAYISGAGVFCQTKLQIVSVDC